MDDTLNAARVTKVAIRLTGNKMEKHVIIQLSN